MTVCPHFVEQDVRGRQQNCGKSHLKTCTSCGGSCSKSATASLPSATQLALEGECFSLLVLIHTERAAVRYLPSS
jgi:hypothetical protein